MMLEKILNNDAWANLLTGMGLRSKDKGANSRSYHLNMQKMELEALFDGDDISERIVTELPEEGTREWIEFKGENSRSFSDFYDLLKVKENFRKAWVWSRLYGGAGIFLDVDDGEVLSAPLNLSKARTIKGMVVLHRFELVADSTSVEGSIQSPNYGKPNLYTLTNSYGGKETQVKIHHTRILRFDGAPLSAGGERVANYWCASVLERIHPVIRDYNNSHHGLAQSLIDFSVVVLKMKNLAQAIAAGNENLILKRIDIANMSKSIQRMIAIDADNESFDMMTRNMSGAKDVLEKVEDRLSVATKMPKAKFLGDSPSGLNSTGSSEERSWYDQISREQERVIKEPLDKLYLVSSSCSQGPTKGVVNTEDTWEFRPLWQASDAVQVETNLKQAQADALYIDRGVISPEAVAKNRFMGDCYSITTKISEEDIEENPMQMIEHVDSVEKIGEKWVIKSKKTGKILGEFESEKAAKDRLREIEYFKAKE